MSWSSAAGHNGKYQHSNKAQFAVFNTITPKIQNRNGIFTLPWCSRNTQCKVSFSGECLCLITQKARVWKRKEGLICVWWISGMVFQHFLPLTSSHIYTYLSHFLTGSMVNLWLNLCEQEKDNTGTFTHLPSNI